VMFYLLQKQFLIRNPELTAGLNLKLWKT
jgi:hypothetical protein